MKKQHKKELKLKLKFSKQKAIVSIIILALVVFAVYYVVAKDKVAAIVGDELIYQKSADSIFNSLPVGSLTKEQILQRIIDTKVLLDYVEKSGFTITDSEFEVELQKELSASGLTKEQFEKSIAASGATLDDFKDSMVISYYVRTQIDPIIVVQPDQIAKFKQENPASKLTDSEIKTNLFKDARQQLIQAIIKLHTQSVKITIN